MSLEVILVVLAGAALHATWNALVKSGSDPLLDTILISVGVAAASAVTLIFVPSPHPSSWPYLAASAAVHLLYFGFMALAYRGSELSVIYPIMRGSSPALTVIAASGAHMALVPRVVDLLKANGQEHVKVFVGGIIPDEDAPRLAEIGVVGVYGPGTLTEDIIRDIRRFVQGTGLE